MYQYSAFVIENKGIDLTKNWVRAARLGFAARIHGLEFEVFAAQMHVRR